METVRLAAERVARAMGLGYAVPSDSGEQPSAFSRSSQSTLPTTDIIHIAFLLHHKLPADLVPMILEYAELWEKTILVYRHHPERVAALQSPRLFAGGVVPHHLPRGSVRLIRFKTVSMDQGWSSYKADHNTYKNSWTWFEAGIVGYEADSVPKSDRFRYDNNELGSNFPRPRPYKYGSKRIVTNLHAHKDYKEHVVEWRLDDEDEDIRQMLKELKGGCGIEVTAYAQFPGWCNHVKSVAIEIECPVIRRM